MNRPSLNELLVFDDPTMQPQGWETAEAQAFRFPQRYIDKCQAFNDYARGLAALEQEKNQLFDFVVRNLISAIDNLQVVFDEVEQELAVEYETLDVEVGEMDEGIAEESATAISEDADTKAVTAEEAVVADEPRSDAEGGELAATAVPEAEPSSRENAEQAPERNPGVNSIASMKETGIAHRGLECARRSILNILEGLHIRPVDLHGKSYRGVEVNGRLVEDPFEIVEVRNQGKATELPVLEVITSLWVQTEPGLRVIRKGQVIC